MTNALLTLLKNRAVRTFITELCVGVAVGVVVTLKSKGKPKKDEISKRVLLHLQEGSPNSRNNGQETEMRPEDKRSKVSEERESWCRKGSSKRDYM